MKNEELNPEVMEGIVPFSGDVNEMTGEILATGGALQKIQTPYATAISVQRPRSITRITNNVLAEARLAGTAFYYGWTAKSKTGPVKIEGPSIDLAMCLARNYGNAAVELDATETISHYMVKAHFVDLESGVTLPRIFRQRKAQSLGGKMDTDRQEDIVFQIGQSKAIRNAIIRAMPNWLIEQAIETAKEAELSKIKPENIALAREKALSFFKPYGISQEQMEDKIARKADDWTAQDITELRANATAVKEGRVSALDLFPFVPQDDMPPEKITESRQATGLKIVTPDMKIMAEYKRLKTENFTKWVENNIERITEASPAIRQDIKVKWRKLHPTRPIPPWEPPKPAIPLDPPDEPEEYYEPQESTAEESKLAYMKEEFDDRIIFYKNELKKTAYFKVLMARGFKDETEVPEDKYDEVLAAMNSELDAQDA